MLLQVINDFIPEIYSSDQYNDLGYQHEEIGLLNNI